MKLTARNIHRDFAYFYLGLIISFSISGIFLNHRRTWHPRRYIYTTESIQLNKQLTEDLVNEDFLNTFTKEYEISDEIRRFAVNDQLLKITYSDHDVEINMKNGEGKIGKYRQTPVLGQMTELHLTTDKWWIYYSDVFGIAMLTIAITGMFITKGKMSFKQRGWKLALAGIIFPLIFLLFL